jgi:hypothetical protein
MLIQGRRGSSAAAFCYVVSCSVILPCNAQQESAMQPSAMQPREFAAYHLPALERDEAQA